ncbi:PIG-L family deacetylase [Streptomyces sioyaensis]|uniref:PIG-L family deacetylase n=1 Tax=Streptomyces sioyaensis TaxID=67364 RepID=UPI0037CE3CCA
MSSKPRRAAPRRRHAALTVALTSALLVGGTAGGLALWDRHFAAKHDKRWDSSLPQPGEMAASGTWAGDGRTVHTKESVLQFLAHPDDDLFFVNPELWRSLATGRPVASVYLTAGEANGVNAPANKPDEKEAAGVDKAKYTKARQNGIRAAYAEMATGDRTSPWRRSVIDTPGGQAQIDVLKAKPQIQVVWLQLHEAGSLTADRPHSLHGLWDGKTRMLGVQRAAGGLITKHTGYTAEQLTVTLVQILKRYKPTMVRTLDPTPGVIDKTQKYADHQDHMYSARFAQRAMARYAETGDRPHFSVQTYLGYFNSGLPRTLDPKTADAKLRLLKTYAWTDFPEEYCNDTAGCGDRKVAARPAGHNWARNIRYTRGNSTSWLQAGQDGTLTAFSVLDGQLAVWHRSAGQASKWSGLRLLPGTGIDPGVGSTSLPDGRLVVSGTRTHFGERGVDYHREVVVRVQRSPGGEFGPWQSLGSPTPNDVTGTSDLSAPALAVDKDGRLTVYVRDCRHQLSVRTQQAGGWAPWRGLGGKDLHGDPVVGTDGSGRHYVFAATPETVLAWIQHRAGAELQGPVPTGLPRTTLPLTPQADSRGVRLYFRKPDSGDVLSVRFDGGSATPGSVKKTTGPQVADLGGTGGFGPISVSLGDVKRPGALLAAKSDTGDLATAVAQPGSAGRPDWSRTGFPFAGAPASARESSGNASVLAVMGLDGNLYWTQTDRTLFTPWREAGTGLG